jgi:hypothetical protein
MVDSDVEFLCRELAATVAVAIATWHYLCRRGIT